MNFTRWFGSKPQPLTGAPAVRRQKTYSAQSGYVYQYYYEGHRPAHDAATTEYVFAVSSDRKTSTNVSVLLAEKSLAGWEREHGRVLGGTERYAVAKMAMFQAFDERADPSAMKEGVKVRPEDVESILATLEIE